MSKILKKIVRRRILTHLKEVTEKRLIKYTQHIN